MIGVALFAVENDTQTRNCISRALQQKIPNLVFHNVWEVSICYEAHETLQNHFGENSFFETIWNVIDYERAQFHRAEWSMDSGITFRERYTQRQAGTRNRLQILSQNEPGVRSGYCDE